MDPGRARQLCDARDLLLDLNRRLEHEVGELVDDEHDVRHPVLALVLFVVRGDVAGVRAREEPVPAVHLARGPVEGVQDLRRVVHHRHDEVGHPVEAREVHPFEVPDQDPDIIGGGLQEEARQDRADADAFPRSGLPGDQEVRQLREVRDDRPAGDVLSERDGQLRGRGLELRALGDVADRDEADREIGDLDPDDALAGNRRLDPKRPRGEGEREVVGERLDPRELDSRGGLELVARDDRPDEHVDDGGGDPEVRKRLLDDALVADELIFSRASCGALI